jgi:hypothetical protein
MLKSPREIRKIVMRVKHRRWWWVYFYRLDYYVPRALFMLAIAGAVGGLGWLALR